MKQFQIKSGLRCNDSYLKYGAVKIAKVETEAVEKIGPTVVHKFSTPPRFLRLLSFCKPCLTTLGRFNKLLPPCVGERGGGGGGGAIGRAVDSDD